MTKATEITASRHGEEIRKDQAQESLFHLMVQKS